MKEPTLSPDNLSFLFPTPAYGSYRVTRDLGDGRAGRTCLAEDPSGRLAVVRGFDVSVPEGGREPLAGFLRQLVELDLEHPSLSDPVASGEVDGTLWVAHRYLPGVTLDEGGAAAPLSAEAVARLLEPVAAALDHAASTGVVHGDLTPRDVICRDGRGALAGIGIVQALGAAGLALTGLAPWASPQRRAGALPTHADDVYALAAIAASLLGVREPMEAGVPDAEGQPAPESRPPVPTRVLAVLARGLAAEPRERPISALSFTALLFTAASAATHRVERAGAERPSADAVEARQVDEPDAPLGLTLALMPEPEPEPDVDADPGPVPAPSSAPELPLALVADPEGWDELRPLAHVESASAEPSWDLPAVEEQPPVMTPDPEVTGLVPIGLDRPAVFVDEAPQEAELPRVLEAPVEPDMPRESWRDGGPPSPPRGTRWAGLLAALVAGLAVGLGAGYGLWYDASDPASAPAAPSASATSGAPPAPSVSEVTPQDTRVVPTDGPGTSPSTSPASPVTQSRRASRVAPAPVRSARTGTVMVRTVPDGARVLIDGAARGRSPVTLLDVAPGTHTVTVERDGYVTERRRVTVRAQQTGGSLQFRLRRAQPSETAAASASAAAGAGTATTTVPSTAGGRLQVESRPTGASVFLDGMLVGTTPLVLSDVRPGAHAVRLALEGYRSWTSPAEVTPGGRTRVAASLDR